MQKIKKIKNRKGAKTFSRVHIKLNIYYLYCYLIAVLVKNCNCNLKCNLKKSLLCLFVGHKLPKMSICDLYINKF